MSNDHVLPRLFKGLAFVAPAVGFVMTLIKKDVFWAFFGLAVSVILAGIGFVLTGQAGEGESRSFDRSRDNDIDDEHGSGIGVNIDGTPMMRGGVDVEGKPFGTFDDQ